MATACGSGSKQEAATAIQTPKVGAKPALAMRKRPGYALTAQAPPKQLLKTAAAPKQSKPAPPVQTAQPSAKPSARPTAPSVQHSLDPRQPQQMIAKQGAAVCAGAARTAAPCAKKDAPQGNADEAAAAAKAPRNRTKAGDLDVAAVETKIKAKHAEQQLGKLSIPEIKCFLKAKNLPVGGKKGDLLERLVRFLNDSV